MLDKSSPQPLYEQIKLYILAKIDTGEYARNTQLPSERQLAKQFGVSRLTVSKAIKQLVQEDRLYVQIGKGTYVGDESIQQQVETLTSFTEEMQSLGQQTTSRVISATIKPASPDVAEALSIAEGEEVVELKRVRLNSQRPLAIECASIVATRCPNILEEYDFSQASLYSVLRDEYGILLVSADQIFEARAATEDEANLLNVDIGTPVLAIHRITYDDHGSACEEVKSVYRGDRYKFRARLSRLV